MAYSQVSTSDVSNLLQKIIAPSVRDIVDTKTIFFNILEKNMGVQKMPNNTFYQTLRIGGTSNIAAVTEGDTLPNGKPSWSQTSTPAKWITGTFNISQQTLEAAKGDPGSLVNSLSAVTEALKKDFVKNLNRIFWGWGNGVLAVASGSGSSATTITLNNRYNNAYNAAATCTFPTEYLQVGQTIMVGSTAATIATIPNSYQITTSAGISWSNGALITQASGSGAATDEPMGMRGIIDDGSNSGVTSLQGITRSSNTWFNAFVDSTSTGLVEADMINAYLVAKKWGDPKYIFTNYKLFKEYGSLLLSVKRSANTEEVLQGGFAGIDFAAASGLVKLVLDYDAPDSELYFVDPESMTLAELAPMGWVDMGSNNLIRITDNLSWQGVFYWFGNMSAINPRANAIMTNRS